MWVLSLHLKAGTVSCIFTSFGSLLNNLGAWYSKHLSELDRLDMIGSRRRPILRSWTFDACSYGSSKSDFNSRFYKLQILIQDLKIIFKLKFRKKCKQFYIWVWNLGIKNYFWPIAWDLDFLAMVIVNKAVWPPPLFL